jgi:hypothetical protein
MNSTFPITGYAAFFIGFTYQRQLILTGIFTRYKMAGDQAKKVVIQLMKKIIKTMLRTTINI